MKTKNKKNRFKLFSRSKCCFHYFFCICSLVYIFRISNPKSKIKIEIIIVLYIFLLQVYLLFTHHTWQLLQVWDIMHSSSPHLLVQIAIIRDRMCPITTSYRPSKLHSFKCMGLQVCKNSYWKSS